MGKVRYGIVSTATIIPRFVKGIRESECGEVVAIAGRDLKKAREMAEELNIEKYYDSYEKIYTDKDVDIVYIATYNGGHFKCVEQALQHGKNVLCEKPLCLTYREAEHLFNLAKEKNVFFMEAQKSVFLPVAQKVKEVVKSGELGEIKWVNIISCHTGAKRGEWFKSLDNGGGILHGAGTYPLEYLLVTFDEELKNYFGNISIKLPVSDNACTMNLRIGENTLVSILWTIDLELESKIEIYGTKGRIIIPNYWKTNRATYFINNEKKQIELPMKSEFVYEINHVNSCILEGRKVSSIMSPFVTLSAIKIIDDTYKKELERIQEEMEEKYE